MDKLNESLDEKLVRLLELHNKDYEVEINNITINGKISKIVVTIDNIRDI